MATTTYTPIENYTLGSAASSITFGSGGTIPQTYTDLIVVINGYQSIDDDVYLQFNGDTSSNYSVTGIYGNGSTATSFRGSNLTAMTLGGLFTSSNGNAIYHIQNYSNATTYKTVLSRANAAASGTQARVGLWRKTPEAITSIKVGSISGNFAAGTTFNLYGIANAAIGAPKAQGGIITYDSTYFYHTFGASGTFTPQQSLTADVLVVAGGGGGGGCNNSSSGPYGAGGGGAGGLRGLTSQSLTTTGYTVTVGGGGAGGTTTGTSASGVNSSFAGSGFTTINASGGGGGGGGNGAGTTSGPYTGGSGGGGMAFANAGGSATGAAGNSGSYSPVEGFAGGNGASGTYDQGGGGGGASAAGTAGTAAGGLGYGGVGSSAYSSYGLVTGTGQNVSGTVYYAAGGGGGSGFAGQTVTTGGNGGGGNGGVVSGLTPTNGLVNAGAGGGGAGRNQNGGNGGSGVVIIRYLKA